MCEGVRARLLCGLGVCLRKQRDRRATEAATCHPGTERAGAQAGLDGDVELGAGHLEVVAQRLVRRGHEPAERSEVARRQRLDGGNPNPAPFYLSSSGYGVLRNTFAAGAYDFRDAAKTRHAEQRFDA